MGFSSESAKGEKMVTQKVEGRRVEDVSLKYLLLDGDNPRFGSQEKSASQEQILDHIVEKFGVDDVLSSLAVNGYFEAEPLVCRRLPDSNESVVVEGNRRLAACLIITNDKRASNQKTRSKKFYQLWKENKEPRINPVPAIIFAPDENQTAILSYLGVRHIASTLSWDSYAKAAWVAQVVETSGLTVSDVSEMIGDEHRTVSRLLEGYYFVRQLSEVGEFVPENSIRKGRGSVTDYPFSWVYTILGYKSARDFLELKDNQARPSPVSEKNLKKSALVLKSMFGDKSLGRSAAVEDSRDLPLLASVLADKQKITLLDQGKTVEEIENLTRPLDERLSGGLSSIREILRDLISSVSEQGIDPKVANELVPVANGVRKLVVDLHKRIRDAAYGDEDDLQSV